MPAGRAMSASDHSLASRWRLRMAPSVARTCSAVSLWANAICSTQNCTRRQWHHQTLPRGVGPRSRGSTRRSRGTTPTSLLSPAAVGGVPGEAGGGGNSELLQVRRVEQVLTGPLYLLSRPHDLDQLLAALGWPDHDRAHQPVVHEEQLPEEPLFERVGSHRLE